MKLSTKTRYAVRAVFDIAYHGQGKATQARDIARRQGVPLRYLEQIFQELKRAKLVEGKRGPSGGYSLARPAAEISLGDVVQAVQGPIELLIDDPLPDEAEAAGGVGKVGVLAANTAQNRQVAASVWKELGQQVRACFDAVTVRDLCLRGESLGLHKGDPRSHMYFI